MYIQLLIDNINSWIVPYARKFINKINTNKHQVKIIHKHSEIEKGDVLVLLSCEKILKNLSLNKYNLVIHESNLPQGKGWSPLTWQVLEGKNTIPITLFEAAEKVDAGVIYYRDRIELTGLELVDELRDKQAQKTFDLIFKFIHHYPNIKSTEQQGQSSFYPKRTAKDSELDANKSIKEQFNLLRVCDNEKYPAFFYNNGIKYTLKIEKA